MIVLYLLLAAIVVGADQLVKAWTVANFNLGDSQTVLDGVFSFYYLHNTGGAFSILEGNMVFFTIITIAALIAAIYYLAKHVHDSKWLTIGMSLFIAGAAGNFIDRIRQGYVVDMFRFDFIDFPIFNVADVSLVIGVIMIFIYLLLEEKKERADKHAK